MSNTQTLKMPFSDDSTPQDTLICLSLVIPCFNEEAVIPIFFRETINMLTSLKTEYELIFVDDGSKDKTLDILRELSIKDSHVHYISFSRNFGKEAAMLAGLQAARGAYIALLDADLQHPPSLVPQMMEAVKEKKYDCIIAKRTRAGDPPFRSFLARCFYRLMSKLADAEITDGVGDFRLMTRNYVDALLQFEERNRFSKGIYPWIGFNTKIIEYENVERIAGQTKWSMFKLFFYSLDGIIAFSTKLLSFASIVGIFSFCAAVILFILLIMRKLIFGVTVDGWTTIACLIVFFSGIILLSIGVLGQYLAKVYTEIKRRPHFIVKESQ